MKFSLNEDYDTIIYMGYSKYNLPLAGDLLVVIGLGLGWVFFQNIFSTVKTMQTVGTVVATTPSLVVQFQTTSGSSTTFTSGIINSSLQIGQTVSVVYNPQFPATTAAIQSNLPEWMAWLIPLGLILLGFLGIYLGVRRSSANRIDSSVA